jgi:hypothetical protein
MPIQFHKLVQFSLLVKADNRLREFNFRKLRNPDEELLSVNVCNERGDRIFFNMQKKENDWKIVPDHVPEWIGKNEQNLRKAIEEELKNW